MIKVSQHAKSEVIKLMEADGFSYHTMISLELASRVEVVQDYLMTLNFDNKMNEDDKVYEDNGVKILVDKKSFLYLIGTTLEYSGGLNGKGFVFNNPNANRTCGCGESFSL